MFKKSLIAALAVGMSFTASADFIKGELFASDLDGINVAIYTGDAGNYQLLDTAVFQSTTADYGVAQGTPVAMPVSPVAMPGSDWSLTMNKAGVEGVGTYGALFDNGDYPHPDGLIGLFGYWELMISGNLDITKLVIYGDADPADGELIVFDPAFGGENDAEFGGAGRPFQTDSPANALFTEDNKYNDELYHTMVVTFDKALNAGDSVRFMVDTDKVDVPEPSVLWTMALGLAGLVGFRKKFSKTNS